MDHRLELQADESWRMNSPAATTNLLKAGWGTRLNGFWISALEFIPGRRAQVLLESAQRCRRLANEFTSHYNKPAESRLRNPFERVSDTSPGIHSGAAGAVAPRIRDGVRLLANEFPSCYSKPAESRLKNPSVLNHETHGRAR